MNLMTKKLIFIAVVLSVLIAVPVLASEWSGNLNTGMDNGTNGVVVTPTPTPTPTPNQGGGGGGGGSYYSSTPTPTPSVSPAPTSLSAEAQKVDANHDGKIDILDFNILMINWGSTSTNNPADFNGDGKVDILDFNLLMIYWS